eukprot:UN25936
MVIPKSIMLEKTNHTKIKLKTNNNNIKTTKVIPKKSPVKLRIPGFVPKIIETYDDVIYGEVSKILLSRGFEQPSKSEKIILPSLRKRRKFDTAVHCECKENEKLLSIAGLYCVDENRKRRKRTRHHTNDCVVLLITSTASKCESIQTYVNRLGLQM